MDENPPRIAPPGSIQKSGREDIVALRRDVAYILRRYFAEHPLPPDAPAFPMPSSKAGAKLMRHDLALTGDNPKEAEEKTKRGEKVVVPIPYRDDCGRVAGFHSHRHTLATMLDQLRPTVSLKVREEIMRHAPTSITMRTYTHAELVEQAEILESLPSLITPFAEMITGKGEIGTNSGEKPSDSSENTGVFGGAGGAESWCQNSAKKSGNHRTSSDNTAGFGTTEREESPIEELLQVHETRPTSEEAGLSEDWHPLGDSNHSLTLLF